MLYSSGGDGRTIHRRSLMRFRSRCEPYEFKSSRKDREPQDVSFGIKI